MSTLILATRNAHKLRELQGMVAPLGIEVVSLGSVRPGEPDVEEDGETFYDNALLKARAAHRATGLPCVADDSGLCVAALKGAPGVRSARYAGEPCDHAANNRKLVEALAGVADRRAYYHCSLVLCCPRAFVEHSPGDGSAQTEVHTTGELHGEIVDEPRGRGGFGYDPHFWLPARRATVAELEPAEKNALSHRGMAFRELVRILEAARHGPGSGGRARG